MPTQLQKGHVYSPGDVVDAPDLNSLVDAGTVLKGAITEATTAAPTTPASDWVLYYNNAVGDLRKCHISQLPPGVTSIGMTVAPTSVFADPGTSPITATGTYAVSLKNQNHNTVLVGPATGPAVQPSFRTLVPADMTVPETYIALNTIDWSLSNTFSQNLLANRDFQFINPTPGQTIRVFLLQKAAYTVAWNSGINVLWPGGIVPVMTTGADRWDMYTFHYIATRYMGTFTQNII